MKIKNQLFLYFFILSIVPLTIFTLLMVRYNSQTLYNEITENERLLVNTKITLTQNLLDNLKKDLLAISHYPSIQGVIESEVLRGDFQNSNKEQQWQERLALLFKSKLKNSEMVNQIRLIKKNGQEIVRVNRKPGNTLEIVTPKNLQNKFKRHYFQKTLSLPENEVFISKVNYNRENGKIVEPKEVVFRIGTPVYNEANQKIYGGIFINIDFKKFIQPLAIKFNKNKDRSYLIMNKQGNYLYHPDPKKWLQFLENPKAENHFSQNKPFKNLLKTQNAGFYHDQNSNTYVIWQKIFFGNSFNQNYWILFSLIDEKIKFAPIHQQIKLAVVFGIALFIFILILSFFAAKRLGSPIMQLKEKALLVASGKNQTKFSIKNANDEIKQTALALEKMTNHLIHSQERLELAIEGSSDGLWDWFDVNQNEEWWSPQFYHILGYQDQEIKSSLDEFEKLLHPEDKEKTFKAVDDHFKKDIPFDVEYRLQTKTGEYKWVRARAKVFRDKNNNPLRMAGSIIDIDRRKKAEYELKKTNQELEEFTYVASHDLQEPLRKIQGFGSILLKNFDDSSNLASKTYIQKMHDAAFRMSILISDLLKFSHVTKADTQFELVDLNQILKNVLSDLETTISHAKAKVTIAKLPKIHGNPVQMTQLFQNLIANAIKYVQPGSKPVVEIKTMTINDQKIKIIVSDNGIGIDPKHFEKIFIPFKRLHHRNEYSGTGIGLALCKKIIERHNGNIYVKSVPGQGSQFILELNLVSLI